MKNLCIVIPVYNKKPSNAEILSLTALANKCPGKYDICFIYPESWDSDIIKTYDNIIYTNDTNRYNVLHESFNDTYFESTITYSSLLKSSDLYNRFKDYKYMLIWQTDCYPVNMTNISEWLDKGYDYVGAPIIANKQHWPSMPCCGNGGLSLRKVTSFIKYTSDTPLRNELDKNEVYLRYEDVYFCEGMSRFVYIDMPTWEDCAEFAWDMNPDVLDNTYKFDWHNIIGCHAWGKNIPYWKDKLAIPDDIATEEYNKNKEFIDIYYRGIGDMQKWMIDCSNTEFL